MPRGNKRKERGKTQIHSDEDTLSPSESEDSNACASKLTEDDSSMEAMKVSIIAEIQQVRTDITKELMEATGQLKKELSDFRGEMSNRLGVIETDMKEMTQRMDKTEHRVTEMEEFSADAREVLSHTLDLQEHLQKRLADLEARSRRNNIRIHGIEEGAEKDDMLGFVECFIKTELALPDNPLGIQRCHRSLAAKPPQGANPRSIVLCFLEFKTKELVLQSAWKKRLIQYKGKRVFFEQDYTTDTLAKRRAYAPIRKTLKEKGVRFQTLHPSRLRVYLQTGPVIYNNAQDAAADLQRKDVINAETFIQITTPRKPYGGRMTQSAWQNTGTTRRNRERIKRIQEKLKEFRRSDDSTS